MGKRRAASKPTLLRDFVLKPPFRHVKRYKPHGQEAEYVIQKKPRSKFVCGMSKRTSVHYNTFVGDMYMKMEAGELTTKKECKDFLASKLTSS